MIGDMKHSPTFHPDDAITLYHEAQTRSNLIISSFLQNHSKKYLKGIGFLRFHLFSIY